jgi:hypothetical protein
MTCPVPFAVPPTEAEALPVKEDGYRFEIEEIVSM